MGGAVDTLSNQYLSFTLREEYFAVSITKVREVLDVSVLTKIPRMPDYICGVINLRGNVVPVIDLGFRLGMGKIKKTVNTSILIIEVLLEGDDRPIEMGVLTDAVQEVLNLSGDDLEPAPRMGSGLNTDFIMGMGRKDDKFMILLDIDKVLASEGGSLKNDMNISQGETHAESSIGNEDSAPS